MALPLKRFAAQCIEVALANGKITPMSSPSTTLYDISREWRQLRKATNSRGSNPSGWSAKEEGAASVIIAAITYLHSIGCKDMEKLLRDTLERKRRRTL